jgi:hypothetical protein
VNEILEVVDRRCRETNTARPVWLAEMLDGPEA